MATFDPMKAGTPGSQASVVGPTKGKDPSSQLTNSEISTIRARRNLANRVEYKYLPSGARFTPRYSYFTNRYADRTIYNYYTTKKNFPRGLAPDMITPAISRILRDTTGRTVPYTIPDSQRYLANFDMYAFAKPGVPAAQARLSEVRSFIDTKGASFGVTQKDAQQMIKKGLLAYVTTKGSDTPRVVTVANPVALENFLTTNYRERKRKPKFDAGGVRVNPDEQDYVKRKPNYIFDDRFDYYMNMYGLSPTSTAYFAFDPKREQNVKRTETKVKTPYVEKSTDPNKPDKVKTRTSTDVSYTFDFDTMAAKYKDYTEADAKWRGKINDEIESNGGARGLALWNKFLGGRANTAEIDELKSYMFSFSPQGTYADVQKSFMAEIMGTNFSDIASREVEEERQEARAAEAEKRRMEEEAEQRFVQQETTLEYFTDVTDDQRYANARALIMEGRAEDISPAVLAQIRAYANLPQPEGRGAAYDPFGIGETKEQIAGQIIESAPLLQQQTYNDMRKIDFINMVNKAMMTDTPLSNEVVALANEFMNDLGVARYEEIIGYQQEFEAFQTDTTNYALGKLAEVGNMGPLSPTPADQIRNNMTTWQATQEVKNNLAKSIVRTSLALPYGLYSLANNPMDAIDAIVSDYERRYSSVGGFIDSTLEDPLAPILDLLSIVPVAGLAVKGTQVAKVAAMTTKAGRGGMTPRQFAKMQRQVMVGSSPNAEAVMKSLMAEGEFGSLNQLYSAGRIDRAASYFEPRYVVLNAADGIPDGEVKGVVDELAQRYAAEAQNKVYVRLAGNPASRGFQNLMLGFQKSTGKLGINLPLIGFQYRFGKALREGDPFVSDLASRELMVERQLQALTSSDLDDAEQMAAWAAAGGNGQGYGAFMAVINRRLEEAQALGEAFNMPQRAGGGEIRLLEVDYDRYNTPEFQRRVRDAEASLIDVDDQGIPRTERGRRVAKMRDAMMLLAERNNRVLKGEADPRTLAAFQRTYALILTASHLLPEDVLAELGPKGANVLRNELMPILNPNIRVPELLNADLRQLPDENGNVIDTSVGGVDEFLDRANEGFATLKQDLATRDAGGRPVLFLDETMDVVELPTRSGTRVEDVTLTGERLIEEAAGPTMKFYPMRYVRVVGNFDDSDMSFERKPLLSDDVVWIPEWAFAKSRSGKIKYKSKAQGRIDTEIAIVNKMNKLFPNARDFVDKISDRAVRGPESFANRQNRNEVIASGLASYQFDVQLAASVRATQRRIASTYEEVINSTAVPITMAQYLNNPNAFVPIKTGRLFEDRAAADAYATTRRVDDEFEAREQGSVQEEIINGRKYYRVQMRFFDAMSITLAEQRLQRMADWETDLSKHFIDTEMIRLMDPKALQRLAEDEVAARYQQFGLRDQNSFILVIPKTTYRRFNETSTRSNNAIMQILQGASDVFKTLVLAMSTKFISQQVVGSSVMLMLARPEWAPQIMANLIAKGAKNAALEATGKGRKIRRDQREEIVNLSELGNDFMILRELFPDDFNSNIFMEDMVTRGERVDRLVSAAERTAPTAAKYMRPLLTNKPARIGGKVAKTITSFGYILAFAFESALRAQIMRRAAMGNPTFARFMDSDVVTEAMQTPVPSRLIGEQTRFHAALRLVADPQSEFYDPFLLREMRYQADSVVGNYRWFTPAERAVRNYMYLFYAWTRHSALFTKRMIQDRPITQNAMYNLGNYGYEEIMEAGGLPEWMLESIPLGGDAASILGLEPDKANFIMAGSINPYGQTARTFSMIQGIIPGIRTDLGETSNLTQGMNPYLVGGIAQQLGVNPLTGIPLTEEEKNQSLGGYYFDMYTAFPVLAQTINLFKTEADLNEARNMNSAEDIFTNPNDLENSELRVVPTRLSERFPTATAPGVFNMFSPSRVMSLEPEMLDEMTRRQWEASGIIVEEQKAAYKSQRTKAVENLEEWRRLRDFVMTYYVPKFKDSDPEMVELVLRKLREQYPSERQLRGLTRQQIEQVLGTTTSFGG